jgi:beta-mannan synthase
MEQAGGWNMDSTVEDMDLSLRAYLNGWKFK